MAELSPIAAQQDFWNGWNSAHREDQIGEVESDQREVVLGWLRALSRQDLELIEVGCGAAWLCESLTEFGRLTATDLSDEVLSRAQRRLPAVAFVAGDFMALPFEREHFDVVVSLEVLSHVADQPAFIAKLASLLRPGGHLMLATQNRPVLQRWNEIPPPAPGQLRRWVDRHELRALLEPHFQVRELFSITPRSNRGLMRLVHSRTLNRPIRAVLGRRIDRLKERLGLGWTLMTLARKRG